GQWFYAEDRQGREDAFRQIEAPHTAVHDEAQAALAAYDRQALEDALSHLGHMEEANREVMRIVDRPVERKSAVQGAGEARRGGRASRKKRARRHAQRRARAK